MECGSRSVGLFGSYLQTKDHIVIVLAYVCQEFVDLYSKIVVFSVVVGSDFAKDFPFFEIFFPESGSASANLRHCILVVIAVFGERQDRGDSELLFGGLVESPKVDVGEVIFLTVWVFRVVHKEEFRLARLEGGRSMEQQISFVAHGSGDDAPFVTRHFVHRLVVVGATIVRTNDAT